jgi:hypothetical protein
MFYTLATVPPGNYNTPEWAEWALPLVAIAARRLPNGPDEDRARWIDEFLWAHCDEADLRALGYCRACGRAITLQQVGRCVYTECNHYRAQGNLFEMQRFLARARAKITPARAAALLQLIGR